MHRLTRRRFLQTCTAAAVPAATVSLPAAAPAADAGFSFVLLGDLHYDHWDHHDRAWLEQHKPEDIRQIENYTRLTREVMPAVFGAVKARLEALRGTATPPALVLQVGDLVEGLCGSASLATRQNREAVQFLNAQDLGLPFLFTKGNHDVTGDGAQEAFDEALLPFIRQEGRRLDAQASQERANHCATHGNCLFAFMDAYDKTSLEWLEAVAARRTAEHFFVTVHPPVVPYGARATWHLFAGEKLAARREKLLALLGSQEALVLGGHLHKHAVLTRRAGGGRFTQLAVSSVVSAPDQKPKDILHGLTAYNGGQVDLEPRHAPETAAARRAIYDSERTKVDSFEYADCAGYAVITVRGPRVEVEVHAGTRAEVFQKARLAG